MKKRRTVLWILAVVFGLGVLAYFLVPPSLPSIERAIMSVPPGSQTADEKKSLASLQVVNDHPFYQMTYYGDYPRYLKMKARFYWAMGFPKPHCTTFAALSPNGHSILGYNNDGEYHSILLLFTDPPNGYASISISDIGGTLPGFNRSFTPFDSDLARSLLLYAPYSTQTGMNEMGLAVGTMTDPEGSWSIDPGRDTVGAAEARRFILDYARDVDEAVALLSQRNVSYAGTTVSHVLLADRSGHSALLEWVDGGMKVIRNQEPWQVSTNFRVYGNEAVIQADRAVYQAGQAIDGDTLGRNHWRYAAAWDALQQADGLLSPGQGMELLSKVSIPSRTNYSIVYDLSTGDVQIVTERDYEQVYRYQLPLK